MADAPDGKNVSATDPDKWDVIVPAIESVVTNVTNVNWGLWMFANDGDCGVGTTPDVVPATGTAAAITSKLAGASPDSSTPTTAAINAAVAYYKTLNDNHSHYLLLATDGEPNCGSNILTGGDDSAAAIAAVSAAAAAGIKTFIVGIGSDDTSAITTLNQMAVNGQEPDTSGTSSYYQVNSTSDLETVLSNAAGSIVSCTYDLSMAPTDPNLVTIDNSMNVPIPRDTTHMNGWDFGPNDMSIVFYGQACTDLQSGVTTGINAIFGCSIS